MASLDELWTLLQNVSILQFKSESRSAAGWTGQGVGIVRVRVEKSDVLETSCKVGDIFPHPASPEGGGVAAPLPPGGVGGGQSPLLREVLIFDEVGTWRLNEQELRFTNVFRWTRQENRLGLEHLRFGAEKPVFLFEMESGEDGIWRSIAPHLCREDHYHANLRVDDGRLYLFWTVRGPRHDDDISYVYE